ncbi:hypothetical protein GALL_231760 [mine drainage metagenome]|uniref:Uncharacterized protein n=1 Tax=mine drainage metagenome TaxID=410659 RepID=A0A1J5S3B2_9ZZZZ
MALALKQAVLKPQDLVVALKVALNDSQDFRLTTLSDELGLVVSAVHGCVVRCVQARLLSRASGEISPIKPSILEFAVHGARYAFPPVLGPISRGLATSTFGPSLAEYFDQGSGMPMVWPDASGDAYGPSIAPLHPCVPGASRSDVRLYDALALFDAIRAGAAREREMASKILEGMIR